MVADVDVVGLQLLRRPVGESIAELERRAVAGSGGLPEGARSIRTTTAARENLAFCVFVVRDRRCGVGIRQVLQRKVRVW